MECKPQKIGTDQWSDHTCGFIAGGVRLQFQPRGAGSTVLDLEDFIVSNLLLPGGSLVFLLFCVTKWGWGFDKYLEETNTGAGVKFPRALRGYVTFVLPVIILVILVLGLR